MTIARTRCIPATALLLLAVAGSGHAALDPAGSADATRAAGAAKPAAAAPATPHAHTAPRAPATAARVANASPRAPQLPEPSALESQLGLQVAHIGVTASGGLVDARFKVLDARKVTALLGNAANAPKLLVGDKPPLQAPHQALHGARFSAGQVFYILYPNLRNVVAPGAQVSVVVGDGRLGPVTAQ